MLSIPRAHPLASFFVLAFGLTWTLVLLSRVSILFGFLALFGPAASAMIVAGTEQGSTGVRALLLKVIDWRAHYIWYVVAVGLPFGLTGAAAALNLLLGGDFPIVPIGYVSLILAVLVVGEEIGWRGFALPRLIARFGPVPASLVLGVLWASWHLANATIPGLERYWTSFPAFLAFVVAQTFLFTAIAIRTRYSILFAWLFHAAINTSGAVFMLEDPVWQWWLCAIVFGLAALFWIIAEVSARRSPWWVTPKLDFAAIKSPKHL
jgi:uncharacterized protein